MQFYFFQINLNEKKRCYDAKQFFDSVYTLSKKLKISSKAFHNVLKRGK